MTPSPHSAKRRPHDQAPQAGHERSPRAHAGHAHAAPAHDASRMPRRGADPAAASAHPQARPERQARPQPQQRPHHSTPSQTPTAHDAPHRTPAEPATLAPLGGHDAVTFGGTLRSEAIKARTYPAFRGVAIAAFVLQVVLALASAGLIIWIGRTVHSDDVSSLLDMGATGISLTCFLYCLAGALTVTGDFSSGVINATALAVGSRRRIFLTKALLAAMVAAVASVVGALLAIVLAGIVLQIGGVTYPWSTPALWFALAGVPLAAVLSALIGVGIGMMTRSTLGATLVTLALFYVAPIAAAVLVLAGDWLTWFSSLHPFATLSVVASRPSAVDPSAPYSLPSWWANLLVAAAWTVASLVGGFVTFLKKPLGSGGK
ncbi:MAG: hypothetical protein E7A62_08415 [Actinomycetaceae bacterium]|nr:hypothetical protein [Actinomycetaceae bacterium]MDU0970998.1 hypothetical protein [Actinomycetaceae bacterium]